jgi:hypothetical protein
MSDHTCDINQGPLDEDGRPLLPNWAELRKSFREDSESVADDVATFDYARLMETMPRLALEAAEFLLADPDASERRQRLLLDQELAEYSPEIDAVARFGVVSAASKKEVRLDRLTGLLNSAGAIRGAHAAIAGNWHELVPADFGPDEVPEASDSPETETPTQPPLPPIPSDQGIKRPLKVIENMFAQMEGPDRRQFADEVVRQVETATPGYRYQRQRDTWWSRRFLSKPLAVSASLIALGLFCGAAGTAYRYASRLAEYEQLHEELGLNEPVTTGEFAVVGSNKLVMDARIDRQVVQRVVLRPKPGTEVILYEQKIRPTELAESIHNITVEHSYDVGDRQRYDVHVEFIPFPDVAQYFPDALRKKATSIDILPQLGVVVGLQRRVQFDVPVQLDAKSEYHDLRGRSFINGWMAVMLRARGTQDWWVQNQEHPVELREGQSFFVPCRLGDVEAETYEMVAIVVESRDEFSLPQTRVQRLEQIAPRSVWLEEIRQTLELIQLDAESDVSTPPSPVVQITQPEDGAAIEGIYAEVTIKVELPGSGPPLVYVRPVTGASKWYLQEEVEPAEQPGTFVARIQVGDSNTMPSTRFQIVSVVVSDETRRAELGKLLMRPDLPEGFPTSEFVTVIRQ